MSSDLNGKVVIVTGASSGIGKAAAELFASAGARVIAFARSESKIGKSVIAVRGDASDERDVDRLFSECESRFGPCEILVNAAGMIDPAHLVRTTPDRWDRVFAVNVRSIFLTCRRALPKMIERHSGSIVNVASISGVLGPEKFPGFVSYNASKAAVIAMTEAVAVEIRESGVRINSVSPGSVDTKMWAQASGGAAADMTPEEVAETILFLASNRSKPISGQDLHVYGA